MLIFFSSPSLQLLEEEEVEVKVTTEQMDTDKASGETDVNMQDAKETSDAAGADNGVAESADKPVQMETDSKVNFFPELMVLLYIFHS